MRINTGRVDNVVARSLQPVDKEDLHRQEIAVTIVLVWPIEGDLDCAWSTCQGIGPKAVVIIEALASYAIVRIVVIGLIGSHRLLVEQIRDALIVTHDENDIGLVVLRVSKQGEVDAARPRVRHGKS